MTNKEASSKQENLVADYLGWKVVSGSGSRPFQPGDVKNDNYLVECKTHTKEQKNIIFYRKHWEKIVIESRAVNKYPALIVDDGSQRVENTWVMIPKRVIAFENMAQRLWLVNTANSLSTITFANQGARDFYKSMYMNIDNKINFFEDKFDGEPLAIMPLEEFKKFYQEQFES